MTIREAEPSDHEAIWRIFHEVVEAGETFAFAPDTPRGKALEIWVRAPHKTFVAERGGHVAGTYFLRPNQPGLGSHVCNAGYMVAREYRGQGIGQALCAHSIEQAARLGYLAMQYNLVVATNPALRLWKRMGFEIVGRLKDAFQMPDGRMNDAFVMYRLLDAPAGGDTMDSSES